MTGTASEMYDFNDNTELSNGELLSAWIFGKINTNCLLVDLNRHGCSVLVPKDQSLPVGKFKLMVMSPDNNEQVHTVLNAEQHWANHEHSGSHFKIGIQFRNLEQNMLQEINLLLYQFENMGADNIKCSLVRY